MSTIDNMRLLYTRCVHRRPDVPIVDKTFPLQRKFSIKFKKKIKKRVLKEVKEL